MNAKDRTQRTPFASISRTRLLASVSLRMFFLVPYAVLVLVTVSSVGYFSFLNGQAAVNNVAAALHNSIALRVKDHILAFLEIPHQITQTNVDLIRRGLIDPNNVTLMQHNFLAHIQAYPSISSIYFGNLNGGIVGSGREGAGGAFYVYSTANLQSGVFKKYSVDSQGNATDLLATVPNFDARTRPWYIAAQQKGDAVWNDVYILSTGQSMAIAASQPIYDDQHNLLGVISVDIFLSQISQFLESLDIGTAGQIFSIDPTGALIADSTGESMFADSTGKGQLTRISGQDSQSTIIRESSRFLLKTYGSFHNIPPGSQQLDLTINGEKQFLQLLPIQDQHGLQWTVAVVVPESAYMAQINHNNSVTFEIILAALVIVFVVNIVTTERIVRRVLQLDHFAQDIAKGKWDQDHGDLPLSRITELASIAF